MLKQFILQVMSGEHLKVEQAEAAMQIIMSGQGNPSQIAALLTALKIKGETSEEIAGFAKTMKRYGVHIDKKDKEVIDTCGTGGGQKPTFNISTTVAFVVAGAGLTVAKHGNRAVSSTCGSADVLKALSVEVDIPPQQVAGMMEEVGIGFLYAPRFHQAMKYAAGVRKELGFRTLFNLLGPLTNPANADSQLIGVYEPALTEKLGGALLEMDVKRAMVVHSMDGMDEISASAPTQVTEVRDGKMQTYLINPQEYGFTFGSEPVCKGGTPEENAKTVLSVLQGHKGPNRDIVLINSAAALWVGQKAQSLEEGIKLAAESIDSGAALAKLEGMRTFTQSCQEGLL